MPAPKKSKHDYIIRNITADLWAAVVRAAAERGQSARELIIRAIEASLRG